MSYFYSSFVITIIVANKKKTLKQVDYFDYSQDTEQKLNKYTNTCGTISTTKNKNYNKNRTETQIKFCKMLAVPILIYGSEIWITSKKTGKQNTGTKYNIFQKGQRMY